MENPHIPKQKTGTRWLIIFTLVFGGEMIFSLPFHVARFFRPTLLEVFNFSNSELGDAIAVYGIMAMLVYFPGGALADRYPARKLMSISLLATAFGGIYFAQIPSQLGLSLLFGWWGITTIFLFWAAMIKVTREWGGELAQGKAFGILDGGRGLAAAAASTVAVLLLGWLISPETENVTDIERTHALRAIIYYYTVLTTLAASLTWFFIPEEKQTKRDTRNAFFGIKKVLTDRTAWLQAIIVVCAYSGYKGLDYYSLYAGNVLGMNEVDAAQFVSNASYLRFISAFGAGLLVDRFSATKVIVYTFVVLAVSYLVLVLISLENSNIDFIYGNIIITFTGVYALRGVYFALLEESKISGMVTGTAVGLISVIGYTPDAFFNSLAGRILDANPGLKGFQDYFLVLAIFMFVGMTATLLLARIISKKNHN